MDLYISAEFTTVFPDMSSQEHVNQWVYTLKVFESDLMTDCDSSIYYKRVDLISAIMGLLSQSPDSKTVLHIPRGCPLMDGGNVFHSAVEFAGALRIGDIRI